MDKIIITIEKADDGYQYDIFLNDEDFEDCNPQDGGLCTTTMSNALGMATKQAKEIIKLVEEN